MHCPHFLPRTSLKILGSLIDSNLTPRRYPPSTSQINFPYPEAPFTIVSCLRRTLAWSQFLETCHVVFHKPFPLQAQITLPLGLPLLACDWGVQAGAQMQISKLGYL